VKPLPLTYIGEAVRGECEGARDEQKGDYEYEHPEENSAKDSIINPRDHRALLLDIGAMKVYLIFYSRGARLRRRKLFGSQTDVDIID